MTIDELKTWFWNKFNNCYYVSHDDYPKSIFMYYDEKLIRKMKLCKLSGRKIDYSIKVSGVCLFEQDYKDGYLYLNWDEINSFFYRNYSNSWAQSKQLIKIWLKDNNNALNPTYNSIRYSNLLTENDKLSILNPERIVFQTIDELSKNDKSKLKIISNS